MASKFISGRLPLPCLSSPLPRDRQLAGSQSASPLCAASHLCTTPSFSCHLPPPRNSPSSTPRSALVILSHPPLSSTLATEGNRTPSCLLLSPPSLCCPHSTSMAADITLTVPPLLLLCMACSCSLDHANSSLFTAASWALRLKGEDERREGRRGRGWGDKEQVMEGKVKKAH